MSKSSRRRPDWVVALAMLVGGSVPGVALFFVSMAEWSALLAGLLFFPCAFIAGCLAIHGEPRA